MIQIVNVGTSNVELGDVTVQTEAPASGVQKEWRGQRSDDLNLIAGSYYAYIKHTNLAGGDITVNGQTLQFGDVWSQEVRTDGVNNVQDFVGSIAIVSGGRAYELNISYPSSSAFDPTTLD